MSRRTLNIGCGSITPDGWVNADLYPGQNAYKCDVASPNDPFVLESAGEFDLIVANHMLSCFSHWQLADPVLPNLLSMLRPGGLLRVLVPDARKAIEAYLAEDKAFFPLGEDLPSADERFCTFLPWFGESKSIFTYPYLSTMLRQAGFVNTAQVECGLSVLGGRDLLSRETIASLDDRARQALVVEAIR